MIRRLTIATSKKAELQEITSQVRQVVGESGINEGVCHIFVPHTTAGVTINEHADPDVARDIMARLEVLAPAGGAYLHVEGNAPGHVKSSVVGCSLALMVEKGQLTLGTWQGIFFAEFDGPRQRSLLVKVVAG
ncbi:MAG: YjbQ family protein [Chloroflexi bacterium]|nr:YjbQ family protein [Chloroflexota bacterium]